MAGECVCFICVLCVCVFVGVCVCGCAIYHLSFFVHFFFLSMLIFSEQQSYLFLFIHTIRYNLIIFHGDFKFNDVVGQKKKFCSAFQLLHVFVSVSLPLFPITVKFKNVMPHFTNSYALIVFRYVFSIVLFFILFVISFNLNKEFRYRVHEIGQNAF